MSIDFVSISEALEELGRLFPPPAGYDAHLPSTAAEMGRAWLEDELVAKYRARRAASALNAAIHQKAGTLDIYDITLGLPAYAPGALEQVEAYLVATYWNYEFCFEAVRKREVVSMSSGRPLGWNVRDGSFTSLGFDRAQLMAIARAELGSARSRELSDSPMEEVDEPCSPSSAVEIRVSEVNGSSVTAGAALAASPLPVAVSAPAVSTNSTTHLIDSEHADFDEFFEVILKEALTALQPDPKDPQTSRQRVRKAVWLALKRAAEVNKPKFMREFVEDDGIKYEGLDGTDIFTKDALRKRVDRSKKVSVWLAGSNPLP
jgi:hypothetical protein